MTAIFVREVRSAFSGMMGWLLTAFLTAASGLYFMANNSISWPTTWGSA